MPCDGACSIDRMWRTVVVQNGQFSIVALRRVELGFCNDLFTAGEPEVTGITGYLVTDGIRVSDYSYPGCDRGCHLVSHFSRTVSVYVVLVGPSANPRIREVT